MATTKAFYALYVVLGIENCAPALECLEHEATHVLSKVHAR